MKDVELAKYIEEMKDIPFQWGVCDCVIFGAGWVERITGKNIILGISGTYDSEEAAQNLLTENYNNSPESVVDRYFKRIEPNFAQIGDVALCELAGKRTFGIVGARGFVFFKTQDGIMATKKVEKIITWRIE